MPHVPNMCISKELMCFSIWRGHIDDKLEKELIVALKNALDFVVEYDGYEYSINKNDCYIIVTATLL